MQRWYHNPIHSASISSNHSKNMKSGAEDRGTRESKIDENMQCRDSEHIFSDGRQNRWSTGGCPNISHYLMEKLP